MLDTISLSEERASSPSKIWCGGAVDSKYDN